MIQSLILSLVATLFIELAISALLGVRCKNDIVVITLANTCTNPVVVFATTCVAFVGSTPLYAIAVLFFELAAFGVEGMIFQKYMRSERVSPFVLSGILNAASYGIGILLYLIL